MNKPPLELFVQRYALAVLDVGIFGIDGIKTISELKELGFTETRKSILEIFVAEIFVLHIPLWSYTSSHKKNFLLDTFYAEIMSSLQKERGFDTESVKEFGRLYFDRYEEYSALAKTSTEKFIPAINERLLSYMGQDDGNLWIRLNSIFAGELSAMSKLMEGVSLFDES